MTTTLTASSTAQLNADIAEVDAAASGSFIIELTAEITQNAALDAIDLQSGVMLTLDGGNFALNGRAPTLDSSSILAEPAQP